MSFDKGQQDEHDGLFAYYLEVLYQTEAALHGSEDAG